MSRSDVQSEARPPAVRNTPSKLGTHLSIHCSRDEKPTANPAYYRSKALHVKYVEDQTSHSVGVEVTTGRRCQLRCLPRHLNMVQNYEDRHRKPWSS
ncbi:hypothetical protein TNCV_4375481 [Trichonephila clavipes]|uniref:Uncharacterized protein n=1 Tax=Trichonephila clavipes TaxID=2585209 RepID=A0A8X6W2E3_TRICX|nr:hypothetical protein TNCV_4375481 [Trichonephila clavipes]